MGDSVHVGRLKCGRFLSGSLDMCESFELVATVTNAVGLRGKDTYRGLAADNKIRQVLPSVYTSRCPRQLEEIALSKYLEPSSAIAAR